MGGGSSAATVSQEDKYYATIKRVSGNFTYIALADPGTDTSDASWLCLRKEAVGGSQDNVDITFADGDADFDNVADNLTSLTYS